MSISLSSSLLLPKLILSSLNLTLIGRPQGIAPTLPRIGLASPCIVGAIPCGRPCAPTEELIQGFPVPPQNSPLAWQGDPGERRGEPCGAPLGVGVKLGGRGAPLVCALSRGGRGRA